MRRFSDKYILKFILKKWSFGFTLISALFFISVNSWANSFYISPSGSDEKGNGSFAKPWQSLFRATSLVTSPGSIIHLMAGKYVEINTSILAPGVSIEGVGESSIILSAIKRDWASVILARSDEGTMGDQHISNLKFDGQNMTAFWAIWISGRSNVSIHNCVIVDFKDRGVIFDGRSDNTQGPPTIFAKGNSFHDNNVTNCAAYNTENGVYGRGSLNIGGQDGMLIYNNIITQDSRPDGYNGWPIKYSNDGYLKGVKIFKNTLIKKPFAGTFGGDNGWDFAIELWHVLGGVEIYDNTIQGSIDIVNAVKTTYNFSAWLHHNTISQKKLNSYFESGMVFEISIEGLVVEDNIFDKVTGAIQFNAQENSTITDIIIRRNQLTSIGSALGKGNNGSFININCGTLFGTSLNYYIYNFSVIDNTCKTAKGFEPFYGILISGAPQASAIAIKGNKITDFDVAWLIINPGRAIDSLIVDSNILTGNGNSNKPLFILGSPSNYSYSNNRSLSSAGASPKYNLKQRIIRPLYYEMKDVDLLEIVAVLSLIIGLWFASKEIKYVFPVMLIPIGIFGMFGFEQNSKVFLLLSLMYIALCGYGWWKWSKRNIRGHRIVRVSQNSKKERILNLVIFAGLYLGLSAVLFFLGQFNWSSPSGFAESFVIASMMIALWLLTLKKTDSWYYFSVVFLVAIPLYFIKNYLLFSVFSGLSLAASLWGLYAWNCLVKRITQKAVRSSDKYV